MDGDDSEASFLVDQATTKHRDNLTPLLPLIDLKQSIEENADFVLRHLRMTMTAAAVAWRLVANESIDASLQAAHLSNERLMRVTTDDVELDKIDVALPAPLLLLERGGGKRQVGLLLHMQTDTCYVAWHRDDSPSAESMKCSKLKTKFAECGGTVLVFARSDVVPRVDYGVPLSSIENGNFYSVFNGERARAVIKRVGSLAGKKRSAPAAGSSKRAHRVDKSDRSDESSAVEEPVDDDALEVLAQEEDDDKEVEEVIDSDENSNNANGDDDNDDRDDDDDDGVDDKESSESSIGQALDHLSAVMKYRDMSMAQTIKTKLRIGDLKWLPTASSSGKPDKWSFVGVPAARAAAIGAAEDKQQLADHSRELIFGAAGDDVQFSSAMVVPEHRAFAYLLAQAHYSASQYIRGCAVAVLRNSDNVPLRSAKDIHTVLERIVAVFNGLSKDGKYVDKRYTDEVRVDDAYVGKCAESANAVKTIVDRFVHESD